MTTTTEPGARSLPSHDFHVAGWFVQPTLIRLTRDHVTVRIRPQLMDLLVCLATCPGRTFPREELFATVWNDRFVAESALARCVAELRHALGDDARQPRIIETISKRGYRLIPPVDLEPLAGVAQLPREEWTGSQAGIPTGVPAERAARNSWFRLPWSRRSWVLPRAVAFSLAVAALAGTLGAGMPGAGPGVAARPAGPSQVLLTFVNTTGDHSFNRVLVLSVAIEVERNAALRVLTDAGPGEGPGADADGGCRRTGAVARLTGSLAPAAGRFALSLGATSCASGALLALEETRVDDKEHLLLAAGRLAASVRDRLSGQSLAAAMRMRPPSA